ncbi:MAG TPA: hypothetical protein VNO55_29715 [Polyangia bacterium]|nr:hypothetical protein [Polyangia bacterium]
MASIATKSAAAAVDCLDEDMSFWFPVAAVAVAVVASYFLKLFT